MKNNRTMVVLTILSALLFSAYGVLAQQADKPTDVAVTVHHDSAATTWAVSPVWMAIGGIALLALIAFIVAASRRGDGGTTIVRESSGH